jgi:hypothetical protein
MIYNLYCYFFQDSVRQVQQFRIDLSTEMVFRFELDEAMMPVRNSVFLLDVKELKDALRQITHHLIPQKNTDSLVEEVLLNLKPTEFLTLFGDPAKYDDQQAVTDFLLEMGHEKLVTVRGQYYLVSDFVQS